MVRQWDRLRLDSEPAYGEITRFELPDLRQVYERAWHALRDNIAEHAAKVRALQDKFLTRDLDRIEEYYGGLLAEFAEKEKRFGEGNSGPLREKIRQRIMAITLDRQKKALDVRAKYRLEVVGTPINLLILYQPWVRLTYRFRTRAREMERSFPWDPRPSATSVAGPARRSPWKTKRFFAPIVNEYHAHGCCSLGRASKLIKNPSKKGLLTRWKKFH